MPFPDPIPGILPFGTVTLVAGAPHAGKTTLLADWCRSWRDGTPILGKPTHRPTGLYYLTVDRGWDSYAPIFADAGYPEIPHYSIVDDDTVSLLDFSKPFQAFELFKRSLDCLAPLPGGHVIVDPVSPIFIRGDQNRSRDVATSLVAFARRCKEYQINLTLTAHFGKQRIDPKEQYVDPEDRISGSGSFSGYSHTQVYLIKPSPPKQPYTLLGWHPRHGPPEEFKLVKGPGGRFQPYTEEQGETSRDLAVLEAFPLPGVLVGFAELKTTIQIATGFSPATIKRALDVLIKDRRVLRMGRGAYTRVKLS